MEWGHVQLAERAVVVRGVCVAEEVHPDLLLEHQLGGVRRRRWQLPRFVKGGLYAALGQAVEVSAPGRLVLGEAGRVDAAQPPVMVMVELDRVVVAAMHVVVGYSAAGLHQGRGWGAAAQEAAQVHHVLVAAPTTARLAAKI